MLYIVENTDQLGNDFLADALPRLSLQRLRQLDERKAFIDKINGAVCYLMLQYALRTEYNLTEPVTFTYGQHGKPSLAQHPDIYFNFSHCRNAAACIVSNQPNSIDIADLRHVSMRTARFFCSDAEYTAVQQLDDPCDELVRLWSQKECYAKLSGDGLFVHFRSVLPNDHPEIHTLKGKRYYCSYYSPDELSPVILDPAEL